MAPCHTPLHRCHYVLSQCLYSGGVQCTTGYAVYIGRAKSASSCFQFTIITAQPLYLSVIIDWQKALSTQLCGLCRTGDSLITLGQHLRCGIAQSTHPSIMQCQNVRSHVMRQAYILRRSCGTIVVASQTNTPWISPFQGD